MEPSRLSLVTTTAISIATVLGTGILGLPVSLHKAGIGPFLFNFTVTMFAQVGVAVAMTELLQRAYARTAKNAAAGSAPFVLLDHDYQDLDDESVADAAENLDGHVAVLESPSLHTMSRMFLRHWSLQVAFEGFVLLHFVSIMSSYALAAPQAYRQLIPAFEALNPRLSTGLFSGVASLLVVFLVPFVLPVLTFATCVKGTLLTVLIVITLMVGFEIRQPSHSDWGLATVEPFLMGIMALSGVVNIMPVTFQACIASCSGPPTATVSRSLVINFRRATVLGILICYVLNIGWCIAVLMVVPQTTTAVQKASAGINFVVRHSSLADADAAGEISTVPLIETLQARGGHLNVVIAVLINVFIAISLTISFFVMGIGMKHTLDGQLTGFMSEATPRYRRLTTKALYYLVWFGAVFIIAYVDPHGFITLLAGVTSLSLNVEAGVFIMYMLVQSRRQSRNQAVLDPALSDRTAGILVLCVGTYFTVAVLIDILLYLPRAF